MKIQKKVKNNKLSMDGKKTPEHIKSHAIYQIHQEE